MAKVHLLQSLMVNNESWSINTNVTQFCFSFVPEKELVRMCKTLTESKICITSQSINEEIAIKFRNESLIGHNTVCTEKLLRYLVSGFHYWKDRQQLRKQKLAFNKWLKIACVLIFLDTIMSISYVWTQNMLHLLCWFWRNKLEC